MIGALTAPKGWRVSALISLAVVFGLAAAVMFLGLYRGQTGPLVQIANAITPLVTVAIVALLMGRRERTVVVEHPTSPQRAAAPGERRLSANQVDRISRSRFPQQQRYLRIGYLEDDDGYLFALDLHRAFSNSIGWKVQKLVHLGGGPGRPANLPPGGLAVVVVDRNDLTEPEAMIVQALENAGLRYNIRQGRDPKNADGELLISRRQT